MSVVVGVNGSAGSQTAIRLAAQEAGYRKAALIAVMVYGRERGVLGVPAGQPATAQGTPGDGRAVAQSILRDALIDALGTQADHVECRVVAGTAGRQLVEAACELGAQLIVLATRGSMSLLLGTVSQYVLRKAPCPVLIVPAVAAADHG